MVAVICREMKWTWQEFMNQPQSFIDTVVDMLTAEAKENKRQNERAKTRGGR